MRAPPPFVTFVAIVLAACPPDDTGDDDTPPRVVAVEPASPEVPVTTSFRVAFSETINGTTVVADPLADDLSVLLVPRFDADGDLVISEQFLSDLDNPPLIESRQNALVPLIAALVDGDSALSISPRAALEPGTAYTLIISSEVRDTAGNPLVDAAGLKAPFLWEITTDAGPPAVTATDIGAAGVVAPNHKRITVTFNQPVVGIGTASLRLQRSQGTPQPTIAAILVEEDRRSATIVLADPASGCERLAPNAAYTLTASSDILGDNGEPLAPYSEQLSTSGACDLVPNTLSGLEQLASDVSATVRFTTTKASSTEVRFALAAQALALDCLGLSCPVRGAPTTIANGVHSVTITGLSVDVDYRYAVFAEDAVGSIATSTGTFRTEALPKVAINEALADTIAGREDTEGEFVELVSFEASALLSLEGWKLRVTKTAAGSTPSLCALPSPAPSLLPGAFLVLAEPDFDDAIYGGIAADGLLRFSAFCALVNEPVIIELLDEDDRPVSSMTLPTPRSGVSVERTAPDAPDETVNVCFSVDGSGASPGRANSVSTCE